MKSYRVLSTLSVIALASCVVAATGVDSENDVQRLCDAAMDKIIAEDVQGAFETLRGQWSLPSAEVDTLVMGTMAQRSVVTPRFGKPLDHVLLRQERVGDLFLRLTYAERRESHALRWQFTWYRRDGQWFLNGIKWDDQFETLFE